MQMEVRQDAWAESSQEELVRKLSALMVRIRTLRALVSEEEDGDGDPRVAFEPQSLRQGLSELEQMAGEILYTLQMAGGELLLADLPGIPLAEALSQLVETTAETLGISSRIVFSGREHPLPDHLLRLLYRIAQETLARVSAHEGTRRLRFSLDYQEAEVLMSIEDDGVPGGTERFFEKAPEEAPPFFGADQVQSDQVMHRLRDMIEILGGALVITSGLEQGTQIQARWPYRALERGEETRSESARHSLDGCKRIKVLIVDDQAVSRAGLRRLLESYPDLEVIGEASDGVQAVSEAAELLPQVVLIDVRLPSEQNRETLHQLRQLNADVSVLLLADQESEEQLYEALRAGASGYLLKDIVPDELARAVRTVAQGEVLVQPQMAARLLARLDSQERSKVAGIPRESLTAREREVLQLLARGLRNKEIAAHLTVSERTVNFHLANIYAKLHVSGRTEALSKVLGQGLLKA